MVCLVAHRINICVENVTVVMRKLVYVESGVLRQFRWVPTTGVVSFQPFAFALITLCVGWGAQVSLNIGFGEPARSGGTPTESTVSLEQQERPRACRVTFVSSIFTQSCVHTRCGCLRCRVICERWFRSVWDVLSAYLSGTEGVKPPAVQGGLGCSLAFLSAI